MAYKPRTPFSVAMYLLAPTYSNAYGVNAKTYPSTQADIEKCPMIFGSFKTYGGTEIVDNGVYTIEDTAQIGEWARDAVCAMYSLGIVNGSTDSAGHFWFHPTAGISRQEEKEITDRVEQLIRDGVAELAKLQP